MLVFHTTSALETIEFGKIIGSKLQKGDIIALQGTLAAGKTTITKGIALSLGITEPITSPTFTLISEYEGNLPLYHLDVYRLDGIDSFIDLGTDDLLYGDGISIIEWSEKIMSELPSDVITIRLEMNDKDNTESRTITIQNWKYGELTQ